MTDPAILFVKPGAIKPAAKKALQSAGVIVVEVNDPSSVKLVRATPEIPGTALLGAAARALTKTAGGDRVFGDEICQLLITAAKAAEKDLS